MREVLFSWLKSLVVVLLITNFLEILLPGDKMRPYVRLIMGLFVLLVFVRPLHVFVEGEPGLFDFDLNTFFSSSSQIEVEETVERGRDLSASARDAFGEDYSRSITRQTRALLRLAGEGEVSGVEAGFSETGQLTGLEVILGPEVQESPFSSTQKEEIEPVVPVEISLAEDPGWKDEEIEQKTGGNPDKKERIRMLLSDFYDLSPEAIVIRHQRGKGDGA